MSGGDRPVLVVDLRRRALEADRRALEGGPAPATPADEPLGRGETVDLVALLHDGAEEPLLLPIEPTADRALLDALARLLRFAVLRGERIPKVATDYGSEHERRLAFERRLPAWAYEGIEEAALRSVPRAVRAVLARRPRGPADRP
jgi:hypothetical protein